MVPEPTDGSFQLRRYFRVIAAISLGPGKDAEIASASRPRAEHLREGPLRARTRAMTRSLLPRALPVLILGVGSSFSGAAFGHAPTQGASASAVAAAPSASAIAPEDDYGDDIQGSVPGASAIERDD